MLVALISLKLQRLVHGTSGASYLVWDQTNVQIII